VIIVTGAAGYIGSHVCKILLDQGYSVLAIDNLNSGHLLFVDPRALFYEGNIQDGEFLISTLAQFRKELFLGVIHIAGLKFAGESVRDPLSYYGTNTSGTQTILSAMRTFGIRNLVFSSSCSVYGNSQRNIPVLESESLRPLSPYGRSKLFAESMIRDAVESEGFRAMSLRYFNVAGGTVGVSSDISKFNIFPNLFRSISQGLTFEVYGDNFQTPDGTCIRDYVDVGLLARAHVDSFESLLEERQMDFAYNLGSGLGYSVYEIVKVVSEVTGVEIDAKVIAPRPGDPAQIMADTTKAHNDLGWNHSISLKQITQSGWDSWQYFKDLII